MTVSMDEWILRKDVIQAFLLENNCSEDMSVCYTNSKIVIGCNYSSPIIYDVALGTIDFLVRPDGKRVVSITAVCVDPEEKEIVTGFEDGSVALWNIEKRKMVTRLKMIQKQRITNASFMEGNSRIVTSDVQGLLTMLTIMRSVSCEAFIQTTLTNMSCPIESFVYRSSCLAFGSVVGVFLLRVTESILSLHNDISVKRSPMSLDIAVRGDAIRLAQCISSNVVVYEFGSSKAGKVLFERKLTGSICRCFLYGFDRLVVIYRNKETELLDMTGRNLRVYPALSPSILPKNICLINDRIIGISKDQIKEFSM